MRRRYERELADTRTTDHDGTILEATDAARRRPDLLPWHHVIVDEYQDVNPSQAAFVHALTTPKGPGPGGEGATLIGVGDDWQAIFGFQGGDASLIRTTADPAGVVQTLCEPITLVNGYRFGQGLADASRAVVTMDPKARDRRIRGLGPEPVGGVPPVSVTGARPTPVLTADLGLFAGGGEILRLARPASRVLRLQDAKTFWPCSRSLALITASWETAVLFHLRAARSAPATSGRRLRPVRTTGSPSAGSLWTRGLRRLAAAARAGAVAGGSIEDSVLRVQRTETAVPDGAADLVAELYRRMPAARPGETPGPRLAARLGAHQPDRGIPLAGCRPVGHRETP